jgi:hypothetical protein
LRKALRVEANGLKAEGAALVAVVICRDHAPPLSVRGCPIGTRRVQVGQRPAKRRNDTLGLTAGVAVNEGLALPTGVDFQGVVLIVVPRTAGRMAGAVGLHVVESGE